MPGRASGIWQRCAHQLFWMGWQCIWTVGASACVIFILHQKIQYLIFYFCHYFFYFSCISLCIYVCAAPFHWLKIIANQIFRFVFGFRFNLSRGSPYCMLSLYYHLTAVYPSDSHSILGFKFCCFTIPSHCRLLVFLNSALPQLDWFLQSACVIFILHQKIPKMAKCTFGYWLIWVVVDEVQKAIKWL